MIANYPRVIRNLSTCNLPITYVYFRILTGSVQELPCFGEGNVDVGTDVVALHEVVEAGFLQLAVHFRIDAGENDVDAFLVVHLDEVLQVVDACWVDEGHFPHADDADLRLLITDNTAFLKGRGLK